MSQALCAPGAAFALLVASVVPNEALAQVRTPASMSTASAGVHAMFAPRRGGMNPAMAETRRGAIREFVAAAKRAGDWATVAQGLEQNARVMGDPVTMMEAGQARLTLASQQRSITEARRAEETTRRALDMLYFYEDVAAGRAESDWLVVDPAQASSLVSSGEEQLRAIQALTAQLGGRSGGGPGGSSGPKPGMAFIVSGAVAVGVGAAGAGLGIGGMVISSGKQEEVGRLDGETDSEEIARLNREGKRANIMGFVGLGIAVAGLAVGIPLLAIGVKRRREGGPSANARLRVSPVFSDSAGGMVLSGRF